MITWLNGNDAIYWLGACAATLVFLLWVARGGVAERDRVWVAPLLIGCLLAAWRWPMLFDPSSFNPDEGQLVAGAQTLARDPVFWRSVDGGTAGPLVFYALLAAKLVGAPISFLTARIISLFLLGGTLALTYATLRRFLPAAPARLALLPAALFFAIATQGDFIHYSTEQLPLLLLAVGTMVLVGAQKELSACHWRLLVGGLLLGLLPWAKLQAIPPGGFVALWALVGLTTTTALSVPDRIRRGSLFVGAGLAPTVLALLLVRTSDVWPVFLQSYLLQNVNYVAAVSNLGAIAQIFFATLAQTWHYPAFFVVTLLTAAIGCGCFRRRDRPWPRKLFLLGGVLVTASVIAVIAPRRPFAHYLLFTVPPLTLWCGAGLGTIWLRLERNPRRHLFMAAGIVWLAGLLLTVRFSQPPPATLASLQDFHERPLTAAGTVIRAFARKGDTLAVWGWMCDLNVETGLSQATRLGNSFLCIETGPQKGYYRQLYLADLIRNQPSVFVDAVGPIASFFQDRRAQAHDRIPEFAAYVRDHFVELIDLDYARVYVRRDRFAETALTTRQLQELTDRGRPVSSPAQTEPVSIYRETLAGNTFNGRFVMMMLPRAELSWTLKGTEREFEFECGYDPRAYLEGDGNGTLFQAELTTPAGVVLPVYSRLLDPVRNRRERGFVRDRFTLLPVPAGSRLTLRTEPGPLQDSRWDWAFLASAAFIHSPHPTYRQFPGFNRLPVDVRAEVASFETVGSEPVIALHAPAELTFRLYGGEQRLAFSFGFRAGAYEAGGNTDGATFRVNLRQPHGKQSLLFARGLHPVGAPADRGTQRIEIPLPPDLPFDTELQLTIDPEGSTAWDWTYLGQLHLQ